MLRRVEACTDHRNKLVRLIFTVRKLDGLHLRAKANALLLLFLLLRHFKFQLDPVIVLLLLAEPNLFVLYWSAAV
jgi:hypothetical protein